MYRIIEPYMEPIDIFEKIGERKSELSDEELGFICGLVRDNRPQKIVEVGVSAGGTSAVVLNCIHKLNYLPDFYSVDLAYTYHMNTAKACGFQIKDAVRVLEGEIKHQLILGKTIAQVLPEICKDGEEKIDMLILDTIHYLPGELLDFIVCLPYLADDAVVILDDLTLAHWGENRNAIATKVLFDTVVAQKCIPNRETYPKMGAFKLNADTRKYAEDLFSALITPWAYETDEDIMLCYKTLIDQNYGEQERNIFCQALRINEESLKKQQNIAREIHKLLEICESGKKTIIFGAGKRGRALYDFLNDRGKQVYAFAVSDDRKQDDFDSEGRRILSLREVKEKEKEYSVILAAANDEIQEGLSREKIAYHEAPNYIFPFIKTYAGYMNAFHTDKQGI